MVEVRRLPFKEYVKVLPPKIWRTSMPLAFYDLDEDVIYIMDKDDLYNFVLQHELAHRRYREKLHFKLLQCLKKLVLALTAALMAMLLSLLLSHYFMSIPHALVLAILRKLSPAWLLTIFCAILLDLYNEWLADRYAYEKTIQTSKGILQES